MCIPSLVKIQIMINFVHESLTERPVVLVTNRVNWSAMKIITHQVSLEALTRWLRMGCGSCRVLLESAKQNAKNPYTSRCFLDDLDAHGAPTLME